MDIEKIIEALLAASPLALTLSGLVLLIALGYKTVPVLIQAAKFSLNNSNSNWAEKRRVEQIAGRVHELASYSGTVLMLKAKVEKLEDQSDQDLKEVIKKIDDHVAEDVRIHAAEQAVAAERYARLTAVEAVQEQQLDLLRAVSDTTQQILLNMNKRRDD